MEVAACGERDRTIAVVRARETQPLGEKTHARALVRVGMIDRPTDRALAADQRSALLVLDEAHRRSARTSAGLGAAFLVLGLVLPMAKGLAMLAHPTHRGVVQRIADTPAWVLVLLLVCCGFLASIGLRTAWRLARTSAPALEHLRRCPDDPFVSAQVEVFVRQGHRTAHFHLRSRRGRHVREVVSAPFEAEVSAALARCMPIIEAGAASDQRVEAH